MGISAVKTFFFQRSDGKKVELAVPSSLNQGLVSKIRTEEYSVYLVRTGREVSEIECVGVVAEGKSAGFLIASSAILSSENPHNTDPVYAAYSLIVANAVCDLSRTDNFELAGSDHASARNSSDVFARDCYYLVIWNKKIKNPHSFFKDYAVSLCENGLILSPNRLEKIFLCNLFENFRSALRIRATPDLPEYVVTILVTLIPFTSSSFLRFFYLYQVIEYLMAEKFDQEVARLQTDFQAVAVPSIGDLKDLMEKFQAITKETKRINMALLPTCPLTTIVAEKMLGILGVDFSDMSFAEKIYKIRNTLFHEYRRLHGYDSEVSDLSENLYSYLLEHKMPYASVS